ncbi:MAG: hypothetical protein HUJ95_01770 [Bacteroidales bacterium]|nr:hypothetical protein [Bacteroidales bacterium]
MKRILTILIASLALVSACKNNPEEVETSYVSEGPYRLCEQKLTTEETFSAISDDYYYGYGKCTFLNGIPFFSPEKDVKITHEMNDLIRVYNLNSLRNCMIDRYERFYRYFSFEEIGESEQDTLDCISRLWQPLPAFSIKKVFPNPSDRKEVENLVTLYRNYEGNDSLFFEGIDRYDEYINTIPSILSESCIKELVEGFGKWYDKKNFVPEIDSLQNMKITDSLMLDSLRQVVEREKDIDRRAILALEYRSLEHFSIRWMSISPVMLGEIIESGLYTRYLYEVWEDWRAVTQMEWFGFSSWSCIPNNYYDILRVKCMNTLLRQYNKTKDKQIALQLMWFAEGSIVGRFYGGYGNEAAMYWALMNPDLFEKDNK